MLTGPEGSQCRTMARPSPALFVKGAVQPSSERATSLFDGLRARNLVNSDQITLVRMADSLCVPKGEGVRTLAISAMEDLSEETAR
jgi:hypothetical protein